MELWRSIPGYEGRYEICPDGKVRSLPKARQSKTLLMKSPIAADGYPVVNLSDASGKRRVLKVHRLVLLTFDGPAPADKPYALHRFGDRSDPRLVGLYWGSPKDNQEDRIAHRTSNKGSRNGNAVLTVDDVRDIRDRASSLVRGDLSRMALEYGVSNSVISDVINNKSWKDV